MNVVYTFYVDFARPQRTNELLVMQGDNMTRTARFILMANGKPLELDEEYAVSINALLPDESVITMEAALSEDEDGDQINEILFPIPSVLTGAVGKSILTISVYKTAEGNTSSDQLSSFEFYVNTRNEIYSGSDDDDSDFAGLRDLLERAAEAIEIVEQFAAQSVLPNPYPLRVLLEENQYDYDGSRIVELDFGNVLTRIENLETSFPAGCSLIAQAVTDNGVTTASNASPSTIATNIGQIRSDGDAAAGEILNGKKARVHKVLVTGTMPNRAAVSPAALNCGESYTIPAGYHNGSGKVTAASLASQTGVDSGKTAAAAAQILTGYQAWVNGVKVTGNMANNGAVSPTGLNAGGSYTIPAGYHNGSGKVTANSLSSQTSGTATAARILNGYTAWVNGSKLTGTYTPPSTSANKTFTVSASEDVDHENGIRSVVNCNLSVKATVNGTTITLEVTGGSIENTTYMWVDNAWTRRGTITMNKNKFSVT